MVSTAPSFHENIFLSDIFSLLFNKSFGYSILLVSIQYRSNFDVILYIQEGNILSEGGGLELKTLI